MALGISFCQLNKLCYMLLMQGGVQEGLKSTSKLNSLLLCKKSTKRRAKNSNLAFLTILAEILAEAQSLMISELLWGSNRVHAIFNF